MYIYRERYKIPNAICKQEASSNGTSKILKPSLKRSS